MSKFPVEQQDTQGIVEAINFVLAGPQAQGPVFGGFQSSTATYLTGNFRLPFTNTDPVIGNLYIAPIALSTAEWLNDFTWKYTFASAQPNPPFAIGNNIDVIGVTPNDFDGYFGKIGVVECSTTYVIARSPSAYPNPGVIGTGGTVEYNAAYPQGGNQVLSTDANDKIVVNYNSSEIIVNAQLNNKITFASSGETQMTYTVQIDRYRAFRNNDAANPDFFFEFDATIAQRSYVELLPDTLTAALTLTVAGVKPTAVFPLTAVAPVLTYPYSYSFVNPPSSGSGSNIEFTITILADANPVYDATNTIIEITDGGQLYTVGDTIVIDGAAIGGVSVVNDMTLTVATVGGLLGQSQILNFETIFSGIIDTPGTGFYWYLLDVNYSNKVGIPPVPVNTLYIIQNELGVRSLTTSVIKQQ